MGLGKGPKVPEVGKTLGIHDVTYDRWHREFGEPKVSDNVTLQLELPNP